MKKLQKKSLKENIKEKNPLNKEQKSEKKPIAENKIEDLSKIPANISIQSLQDKISESLDLKKAEGNINKIKDNNTNPAFETNFIRSHSENTQSNTQSNNPPAYSQFPMKNFMNPQNLNNNNINNTMNQTNAANVNLNNMTKTPPNLTNIQTAPLPNNNQQGMPNMNNFNLPVLYLMMPNGQQVPVLLTPVNYKFF